MRISRTEIAAGVRCAGCWPWDVSVSVAYTCETCGEIDATYIYIYIVSFLCRTLSMVFKYHLRTHDKNHIAETSRHLDRWFHHLWRSTCPAWLESSGYMYTWYTPMHWRAAIFDLYTSTWVYTTVDIYIVTELNPVLTTSAVCADLGWGKPPMSMLFDEPSSSPKCV